MIFDLDVCSPGAEKTSVPATRHYTVVDNGLTSRWFGTVWMNPPYTGIRPWTRKLVSYGDGIALVFARTDTAWFQEAAASATLLCFVADRISFINGDTGQPAGSPGTGPFSSPMATRQPTLCVPGVRPLRRARNHRLTLGGSVLFAHTLRSVALPRALTPNRRGAGPRPRRPPVLGMPVGPHRTVRFSRGGILV